MIESVGSLELLSAIDKQAEKLGVVQDILLEVNIGGEEAKSGFAPESPGAGGGRGQKSAQMSRARPHVYPAGRRGRARQPALL